MTITAIETEELKMTELGSLPGEWRVVKLRDVASFTSKPRGLDIFNCETVPFIPMEAISSDGSGHFRYTIKSGREISSGVYCERGDLLLAKITPCLENGKQCLIGLDDLPTSFAYSTTEVYPLKINRNVADSLFIFYYLLYPPVRRDLAAKMEGTTARQRLPKHVVQNLMLPLPPLSEQKKIAHVLSIVQAAIEKAEAVIAASREFKKSLIKHVFTYGPVSIDEAESVLLKETEIGLVPESWEVVRLGDFAEVKYGKANPKDSGLIPVVGSGGVFSYTATPLVEHPTIVVGRKGTAGRAWLFQSPCYPADTTFYLRWKKKVDVTYLYSYMILHPLSGIHAKTTLPSLQKPDLENMLVPCPSLATQELIADLAIRLATKVEAEEGKKQALEALFQTLLKKLITGKIRVNNLEVPV